MRDCEGNHLSFPIPPIELLEHMLQHPEKRPIRKLLAPCLACLQQVHEELRALCSKQLQHPSIARFPQLQATIRDVMGALLQEQQAVAQEKLDELVRMEEAYISTDDPAFLAELQGVMKKLASRLDVGLLRSILTSYYATVQRAISNSAPKAIMCFLVRGTQASVSASLFERIARQPPANVLDEPPEVDAQLTRTLPLTPTLTPTLILAPTPSPQPPAPTPTLTRSTRSAGRTSKSSPSCVPPRGRSRRSRPRRASAEGRLPGWGAVGTVWRVAPWAVGVGATVAWRSGRWWLRGGACGDG